MNVEEIRYFYFYWQLIYLVLGSLMLFTPDTLKLTF